MWKLKGKGRAFKGTYEYQRGERMFWLVAQDDKPNGVKAFESWQAARAAGWVKV